MICLKLYDVQDDGGRSIPGKGGNSEYYDFALYDPSHYVASMPLIE